MEKPHSEKSSHAQSTSGVGSAHGADADAPGQATAGTDRAEVDSDRAHSAHHVGGSPANAGSEVSKSEEAKNQEATSRQSRALSGTTAPRKV